MFAKDIKNLKGRKMKFSSSTSRSRRSRESGVLGSKDLDVVGEDR